MNDIRLTQYSHGAGCGCKISPKILDEILMSNLAMPDNLNLIVGNHSKDDAAVYDLGDGNALISTTDFFMPIVDDPYSFGRIASANAISDVYAMGGKPILAIAILGWPINSIPASVAQKVIEGSRSICLEAGIPLAGGHSIDSPEPIFGLAVNGLVPIKNIKQNNSAKVGDVLFLTKRIGVGILTTAEKKGILKEKDFMKAADQMMQLNHIGLTLGKNRNVHSMTDITGFGLLGHLAEMSEGSHVSAEINFKSIKLITDDLEDYLTLKAIPGGTIRNLDSYEHKIDFGDSNDSDKMKYILCDPQTSGGLLISVSPDGVQEIVDILIKSGLLDFIEPIGYIKEKAEKAIYVNE